MFSCQESSDNLTLRLPFLANPCGQFFFPIYFSLRSPIHPPLAERIKKSGSAECLLFGIRYW